MFARNRIEVNITLWVLLAAFATSPTPLRAENASEAALSRCVHLTRIAAETYSGRQLPRFVSLRFDQVNVRRGPDFAHEIDWLFTRTGMPLMVIAEHRDWRKICDSEGETGWIHSSQLSGTRTTLVLEDRIVLRLQNDGTARILAKVEEGVILELDKCDLHWCLARVDALIGWARRSSLWGVLQDEFRE